ncbi:hypothetical protein DRP04_03575 [Archaeoglobales archaeon]|nr:MAG: hypothetical protein DRP04_03575 [Archaeoglobales archaeon]
MDKLEALIRELTAIKVKLDNVCSEVRSLAQKIEKDHDMLIEHDGKIAMLENWVKRHENRHSLSLSWRIMLIVMIIASASGAFFSWLFGHM